MSPLPDSGVKEDEEAQGQRTLVYEGDGRIAFDYGKGQIAVILPYPFKGTTDLVELDRKARQMIS